MNRDEEDMEEREIFGLLSVLDEPPPQVSVEALMLRAESAGRRPLSGASWRRRAAGILAAAAIAGAAYAIPGSPVRGWIHDVVGKFGGAPDTSRRMPAAREETPAPSGIAVSPGQRLIIDFGPARGGEARISLSAGSEVEVEAPAGAAGFSSSADRLLVVPRVSSVRLEVRIPRTAPWVEVRVNGARVFLVEGSRVTTQATRDRDAWVIPF